MEVQLAVAYQQQLQHSAKLAKPVPQVTPPATFTVLAMVFKKMCVSSSALYAGVYSISGCSV